MVGEGEEKQTTAAVAAGLSHQETDSGSSEDRELSFSAATHTDTHTRAGCLFSCSSNSNRMIM